MSVNKFEQADLVVIGGGPAGSTISTLVAMQGHRVLLIEQDAFPRHQIGESLLPSTIHGICPLLGVSEDIKNANFTHKYGGAFRWGKSDEVWTFNFSITPATSGPTGYAYQVERSKFDAILLNNARRKGVHVNERSRVTEVIQQGGRVTAVKWIDADGTAHTTKAKFVADASGNRSCVSEHVGQRLYSKFFQNVALYAYYRNGKRLPKPIDGNTLSAAFGSGWFWYIPLSPTLTSVGAVMARERIDILQQGRQQAMDQLIGECPIVANLLQGAERVTEGPYGEYRIRKDYSYCCTKFWAPGMVLVGDAACFVDPVFSSGVHLATYSGLLAARSVNSCLRGGVDEEQVFAEFEMRYRREYSNFYQFLTAFYDMNQDPDSYFWSARKVLNSEERANEAFVRLVAGMGSSGEPLFGSSEEFFSSLKSVGNSFASAQSAPGRFEVGKFDQGFFAELTKEGGRLQLQSLPAAARAETPLWRTGLIPTPDGLHWQQANA